MKRTGHHVIFRLDHLTLWYDVCMTHCRLSAVFFITWKQRFISGSAFNHVGTETDGVSSTCVARLPVVTVILKKTLRTTLKRNFFFRTDVT